MDPRQLSLQRIPPPIAPLCLELTTGKQKR